MFGARGLFGVAGIARLAFVASCGFALGLSSEAAQAADPVAPAAVAPACGTENLLAGKQPIETWDIRGDLAVVTDQAVPQEGALWDAPAALTLLSEAGSLTYDLGAPRPLRALYLQGDANDLYRVTGSLDGTPGSFQPVVELSSALDRGHGLRDRAQTFPAQNLRYLRIGNPRGDGLFSISELAAYCQPPTPFPPQFAKVEAPLAAVPRATGAAAAADEYVVAKPRTPVGPVQWILAGLIALFAGAELLKRRRRTRATRLRTASISQSDAGANADAGLPTQSSEVQAAPVASHGTGDDRARVAPTKFPSKPERFYPVLLLFFMGSGCAALIYEIVWFQLLQLVIGSSAVSIGVLLGTYMAGLCVGSLALPRFISARQHPLRVYALLELGIAAAGLLMLVAMPLVQGVYTSVVGHGVPGLMLRGVFAALCLLIPTALMGATLPAAARWVETSPRGVSWLGYLYGANTLGAVTGCLLAGFYLLRVHDMVIATFVAVALNVIVALAAFGVARLEPRVAPAVTLASNDVAARPRPSTPAWLVYVTIGLSGMGALGAEVLWTRLFTLLLGGTTYTFSIILGMFLIGIGFGSWGGSEVARRTRDPLRALGVTQLLIIVGIAWAHWNITEALPYWPVNPNLAPKSWYQFQLDIVRCLWTILPAACLWGASFPLALASVAERGQDGGVVVGRVYAANTVGAIVGALATSLVLIGAFGSQDTARLLIAISTVSALLTLTPQFVRGMSLPALGQSSLLWALVVIEVGSLAARNLAPVPPLLVAHGRHSGVAQQNQETYLYVGEGMNSSLAVSRDSNGIISYHNAGKVQASTQPQDMRLQRMLGHLTTLLPENPRDVLVIACGAGVTAGAASVDPRLERLTIAEIEPLVPPAAGKYFGDYNQHVIQNPKVRVEVDDARHFLNTTDQKFDAITSDPFDPWVKGAAALYTKEFWELAKSRLKPGGVVTVFVQLYQAGTRAVKSEVATFFAVFPEGVLFGNTWRGEGYDVVLVGQRDPAPIDVDKMERHLADPAFAAVAKSLREIGFNSAVALLSTYGSRGPDLKKWLENAEINEDRNLRLQFLAGFDLNANEAAQIYREILPFRRYPKDLFNGSPERIDALGKATRERPP